ncbi:MAG: S49 family peptidase [Gammaproteobacteria bacterium]
MSNSNHSENNVLEQLALDYMKEKKRKRRWGIFYKSIFVLLGLLILFKVIPSSTAKVSKTHTALIDIQGPIFSFSRANADNLAESLKFAYEDSNVKGIILRINSPGGSAVQADYMFNEIMRQREKNPDIKVYAVCTEACNSAAYYIAAAADEIYAAPSSLVGAIGVLFIRVAIPRERFSPSLG